MGRIAELPWLTILPVGCHMAVVSVSYRSSVSIPADHRGHLVHIVDRWIYGEADHARRQPRSTHLLLTDRAVGRTELVTLSAC